MLTIRDVHVAGDGTETETWSVVVPSTVEAAGPAAIDAYVAQALAARSTPTASDVPPSTDEED